MDPVKVLHRINLNVAGGVENQFRAFIEHPSVREQFRSQVLIGEPVHTDLAEVVYRHTEEVHSFKRWYGIKLPRRPAFIRDRYISGIIRAQCPHALLSWSAFAKPRLAAACARHDVPLLYREGGGAWGEVDRGDAEIFLAGVRRAFCNTRASMRMLQLKWGYAGDALVCLGGVRPGLKRIALESSGNDALPQRPGDASLRIGVAARLVHEKGVCLALHTLRVLRARGHRVELLIAGQGDEQARLEALAARLGLSESVHFLGGVSRMERFYQQIDVLLHPALQEPLGNSTIEAAVFGRPVVATRVDGLAETVKHGVTGYCLPATGALANYPEYGGGVSATTSSVVYDPDADSLRTPMFVEPEAFADSLDDLLSSASLRREMGSAAQDYVLRHFSYERHIEAISAGIVESVRS